MDTLPQGLASLPNELIIIIFNYIKKITDKRQFLKTCKLHNTLLKGLIMEMSESELDYLMVDINNVDYVRRVIYYYDYLKKRDYCVEKFMMELCYDSYFDMIPLSYITGNMNNATIIKLFIKYGKLELLKLIVNEEFSYIRPCLLAAESGSLDILMWLTENKYIWDNRICAIAALNGHFDIIKWARVNNYSWDMTCSYAAKKGHLEIIKWVRANGGDWDKNVCSNAAEFGHLNVLKWARENGCDWDAQTCASAAFNNHLDILIWARENGCKWDENTIKYAITNKSFDTLKWARENGCPDI